VTVGAQSDSTGNGTAAVDASELVMGFDVSVWGETRRAPVESVLVAAALRGVTSKALKRAGDARPSLLEMRHRSYSRRGGVLRLGRL
jgi:hypothetical protein